MSQLWQQQLLYKQLQLQELHRQQQHQQQQQQNQHQQQQNHGQMTEMPSWQNNHPPSQMGVVPVTNHPPSYPGQMTEVPSWANMVPSPQMLFPTGGGGQMNWAQYGMNPAMMNNYPNGMMMQQNNPLQSMRNMGMVPQQMDPSIFQNPQFLGMTPSNNNNSANNNNENMMNRGAASGAQSETYNSYQQTVPDQVQNFLPENTTHQNTASMQNFLGGSSFSSPPVQSMPPDRPTTGGSSLDPEEEKLLYGDDNWLGSFGKSVAASSSAGGGFVNSMDDGGNNNNNNVKGGFSSLQSGSWSALMQDALDASSSDTGQNEEWSGLAIHNKTAPPVPVPVPVQVPNQSSGMVPNYHQNSAEYSQNHEQHQLANGIWGQDNSNNSNSQFAQRGQNQGVWVTQQNRQQPHNFPNQNQAGSNNSNNKPNGWNSNNTPAQTQTQTQTGDTHMYGMQPPKNFGMNPNLSKVNQEMRRQEENKQESPVLFPNPNQNPNPSSHSGYPPAQLGMQMTQQHMGGNLGMNFGGNNPFGSFPLIQSQLNQQAAAKNQDQGFKSFNEQAQHTDKRDEEINNNSRGGVQSKENLFNGSSPRFSHNRIGQPSQNMLDLFQKSQKSDPPAVPDNSQSGFDRSSPNPPQNQHMQNFGLMLGPPSQRQQPSKSQADPDHHTPAPSTSSSQHSQGENTDSAQNRPKEAAGTGANTGTMFKNVWTNVSTQPRNKNLTPSIIQSMMLNSTGTGTGEAGTSSASSAPEERQLLDKNSLNVQIGSKRGLNPEENVLQGRPLNTNANYSLLNQVQSMRSNTDLDAGNRLAKRLRPDHGGPVPPTNFVSRETEEKSMPVGAPVEPADRPKTINPQMAPSWFEQYGNYRNGQNIPSVHESQQRPNSTPQFSFPKVPWNADNINNKDNNYNNKIASEQQGLERSPVTPISRFRPQTIVPVNNYNNKNVNNNIEVPVPMPVPIPVPRLGASEAAVVPATTTVETSVVAPVKEKSRKTGTRKMVPFHKVTEVPESIRSSSVAEMDWAQTANRLFDKVDEEMEMLDEGQLIFALSRRRLIFTTKLTQHLVPAIPPKFLRAKADSSYETITYFVSNFALRDACSLICPSSNTDSSDENTSSGEKGGEKYFSKVAEAFGGRFKKLEEDFIRLNKRTSVLELQLECQELERFSIVNRLGRFHGRGHLSLPDGPGPDTSSGSRPFFQRAVTASPMPKNISDSATSCLLL